MSLTAEIAAQIAAGHPDDCMCVPCINADMDAHVIKSGGTPVGYGADAQGTPERTRYATPGQKCGRGVVRRISEPQKKLVRKLMRERDTTKLTRLPGSEDIDNMSLAGARDLIDRLFGCPMLADAPVRKATEGQIKYARGLAEDTGQPQQDWDNMTLEAVRAELDRMKVLPRIAKKTTERVAPGIYFVDGVVYKVQLSKSSGYPYALALEEDTRKFVYAHGAIKEIRPEHKMTLEQAKKYGKLTGSCCVCGKELTRQDSIDAGIGPICAKKF